MKLIFILSYIVIFFLFFIIGRIKAQKQKKRIEIIKESCASEISRNEALQQLIAEEYGLKPEEMRSSVFGGHVDKPIGYVISTVHEENENWVEYMIEINTTRK